MTYKSLAQTAKETLIRNRRSRLRIQEDASVPALDSDLETIRKDLDFHISQANTHDKHSLNFENSALNHLKDGNLENADYWIKEHKKHRELAQYHRDIQEIIRREIQRRANPEIQKEECKEVSRVEKRSKQLKEAVDEWLKKTSPITRERLQKESQK